MFRFFVYICPVLINYMLGGVFFITAHRLAEAQAPAFAVTATLAVWSALYFLISFLMGKVVSEKNALSLVIAGALLLTLSSLGFLFVPGLYAQFLWIAVTGIGAAVYCTPFQVFMKAVEPARGGVVRADSLYTISWSIGMGAGPFLFGLVRPETGFLINTCIGLGIAAGMFALKLRPPARIASAVTEKDMPSEFLDRPDKVLSGWVWGGAGCLVISIVRTLLPWRTEQLGLPKMIPAFSLTLICLTQALTALVLIRSRKWMYSFRGIAASGLVGILSLILMGAVSNGNAFLLAGALYGIYSGVFYFYFVFHSLVHPQKSAAYVAGNEMIVGVVGIAGPLLAGALTSGLHLNSFFASAAVVALTLIVCRFLPARSK